MKILQVNVRLNEGGAAGVALDLHQRLSIKKGYGSRYSYGYGKGAKPNKLEKSLKARHVGSQLQVALNYVSHKILNYDAFKPTSLLQRKFHEDIEWADVVHLHVIHSYFTSFGWLVDLLVKSQKKIVWTLHDHWIVTGRCAITDGCLQWKNSCKKCPDLSNYPSVFIDRAKNVYPNKYSLIEKLSKAGCVFVSPSQHLLNDIESSYPYIDVRMINNALDLETEKIIDSLGIKIARCRSGKKKLRILVIAHDLKYRGKTNIDLINELRGSVDIELHTVGENTPFYGDNVVNHGYINSKRKLYEIYQNVNLMLFSSTVDNFPLVIGEALSVGTPVIASNSVAAKEVLSLVGGRVSVSSKEIISAILDKNWMKCFYSNQAMDVVKNTAMRKFSGRRLLDEYTSIYQKGKG